MFNGKINLRSLPASIRKRIRKELGKPGPKVHLSDALMEEIEVLLAAVPLTRSFNKDKTEVDGSDEAGDEEMIVPLEVSAGNFRQTIFP